MTQELNALGYKVSENTVAKLMKENAIESKRKWSYKPPKTTTTDKNAKYNDNLIKENPATQFGEQLVADITYIPTKKGWLYLSVIIDLYTRVVVGWETSERMAATLVRDTLENATGKWSINTRETIFHSDRGSQYTSHLVRKWLWQRGVKQSMSKKGYCYDNAHCESFFSSLKAECLPPTGYFETRAEARQTIFGYIEGFYNTRRRHSALNYISPIKFYQNNKKQFALSA